MVGLEHHISHGAISFPAKALRSLSPTHISPGPKQKAAELTNMVIGQPLQETGLITARWGLNAGCQGAEVSLTDVQQEVSSRAQLHLGAAPAVIWKTSPSMVVLNVVSLVLQSPHPTRHSKMSRQEPIIHSK